MSRTAQLAGRDPDILELTPPQFDNDTSFATTAFVQRALGNFSGLSTYSTSTVLNVQPSEVGKVIQFGGASQSYTLRLPDASLCPSGSSLLVKTSMSGGTLSIEATGAYPVISRPYMPDTVASFSVENSEVLLFVQTGGYWTVISRLSDQWITKAQFDNSRSIATTEFVQRALGSYSGQYDVTASASIPASACGKRVVCSPTGAGVTYTLPAKNSASVGSVLYFENNTSTFPVTIQCQAGETIGQGSSPFSNSFVLAPYDTVVLTLGAAQWNITGGDVRIAKSGGFFSSIAASGYQKIAGGLIVQWGVGNAAASGTGSVTFPIAFPNAVARILVSPRNGGAFNACASSDGVSRTLTGFPFYTTLAASGSVPVAQAMSVDWIAIGY